MTTKAPIPVDVPITVTPIGVPTSGPQSVPPGPGTTGQVPTVPTPVGPLEKAPPPVATGQTVETTATIPVPENPVDIATSAAITASVPKPIYIRVSSDNTVVTDNTRVLNFMGPGVSVSGTSSQANITITGSGPGGSPGGSNTQIQFNNSGLFGGTANLTFDVSTRVLGVGGSASATGNITGNYILGNGSQLTGLPATYGNSNVATYLGAGQVGNIIPLSNAVYSLGNATNQWAELYVSNNSIVIGGVTLAVSGNTLSVNGTDLVTNTALGVDAGGIMQGYSAIAIGTLAGNSNQGLKGIAIGDNCGRYSQSANSIAIGSVSGRDYQGTEAVAFGRDTGLSYQGNRSMAMGTQAGSFYQGQYAIAFGYQAGRYNQGANSVTIGAYAGYGTDAANPGVGGQANNSIVINATGANLTNQTANTFTVAPVRNLSNVGNVMFYNTTTNEITYGNTISIAGNVTGGNLTTAGIANVATLAVTGSVTVQGSIGVSSFLSATSNVTGGNILTGGLISATGNITGGNILGGANVNATTHTGATVSVTGNITGSYFIGNGSQLTGIVATSSYGNANVAANLAAFGSNPVSTTGNITAGNFIGNVVGGGAGTPTISSATNLDLSAAAAVRVIGGGTLRLPNLTTAQIANIVASNGDMTYNTTTNKIQAYANGAWGNITLT
jgi:hypothetical protein